MLREELIPFRPLILASGDVQRLELFRIWESVGIRIRGIWI